MDKPSLNQLTMLTPIIKEKDWFKVQFGKGDDLMEKLKNITLKEYKYLLFLVFNRKSGDIRKFLLKIGVKPLPQKYDL